MLKNIKNISKILGQKIDKGIYKIPKILVDKIESIIDTEYNFDKSNRYDLRKYNNYKDCALFFIIYIMLMNREKNSNLIYVKKEDKEIFNFKWDSEFGCQIPVSIMRNVLNSNKYEEIKQLLLSNNIIKIIPLSYKKKINYSKNANIAIRYAINSKYLEYFNFIEIENRYIDKYKFLYKNDILFGDIRNSIDIDYIPYENSEKNYQYKLQKELYFDNEDFKKIFFKKYKSLQYITNPCEKLDIIVENKYKENKTFSNKIINDYKIYYNINKHIFKAVESNGRIYLPFHYMSKEYRSALRLDNYKLREIYDIKCCFLYLSCNIFKKQTKNIKQADELLRLIKDDIYLKIGNIINLDRNIVKTYIMKFLFTRHDERNDSGDIKYLCIVNYFKKKHKEFFNWLQNYKMVYNKEKDKYVSQLSYDCMKLESDIMFDFVLPILRKRYNNVKFLSLHDGIWTTENISIDFTKEIDNLINNYIKDNIIDING